MMYLASTGLTPQAFTRTTRLPVDANRAVPRRPGLGEDTVIGGGLLVKRMPEGEAALYSQTTIVLGRSESDILDYQE